MNDYDISTHGHTRRMSNGLIICIAVICALVVALGGLAVFTVNVVNKTNAAVSEMESQLAQYQINDANAQAALQARDETISQQQATIDEQKNTINEQQSTIDNQKNEISLDYRL